VQHHKLATIEDVAALAGVSIATVSRAINEPTKVADATRRKVAEAVARTGYTTNAMARSLPLPAPATPPMPWPARCACGAPT